jgi:competence protein ComGA
MEEQLDTIIKLSLTMGSSDVHIMVKGSKIQVMIRGKRGMESVDCCVDSQLIRYICYLAHLDISNQMAPQSGVFEYFVDYVPYYIRVATMQGFQNQSLVLRLMNRCTFDNLTSLTKDFQIIEELERIKELVDGLVVIAGATGSGKTTTAYCLLKAMEQRAVYAIEDPIEIYHEGFVQLQVNPLQMMGFEQAIKQVLRHDPDVIFIGEIRDQQEAAIALRCALTGHLVIVTVHSGSVEGAWLRLMDLGIKEHDLRHILRLVIFQQMVYQPVKRVDFKLEWSC